MSFSKKMLCGALVTALSVCTSGVSSVNAAVSDSFSLHYNSFVSGLTTESVKLPVYGGTNYFKVSKLWGSATSKTVSLKGSNVKLGKSVKLSSAGTVGFKYTLTSKDDETAVLKVKLSTPKSGTSYATGKVYF